MYKHPDETKRDSVYDKIIQTMEKKAAARKRMAVLGKLAAVIVVAVILIVTQIIIPRNHYQAAVALKQAGKYEEAIAAFEALNGYSDSSTQIEACRNMIKELKHQTAVREAKLKPYRTAGSYVTFGTYPQTAAGDDSTPIEWQVLDYDKKNHRALLLSKYGLDVQPYNTIYTSITWEKCTLRAWLNSDFLNKAFTTQERMAILTTNVDNSLSHGYSGFNTDGGNNTQDKVFLLSYKEANKYLGVTYFDRNNTKSRVLLTAYAIQASAFTFASNRTAEGTAAGWWWWWLRSPGSYQPLATGVDPYGSLLLNHVDNTTGGIRPALWINLESDIF